MPVCGGAKTGAKIDAEILTTRSASTDALAFMGGA